MERNNIIIDRYIANSYCLLENKPALEAEYEETILGIARGFGEYLIRKQLLEQSPDYLIKIIYAFDKTSSALSFSNEICLVVNRFFVQTLNNLNKILFHALEEKYNSLPMFAYLFRLMKEQAYVSGHHEYAIFIEQFIKQQSDREIEKVWRNPTNIQHIKLTEIQEAFIIAHEIAHLLVGNEALSIQVERNKADFFAETISSAQKKSAEQDDNEGFANTLNQLLTHKGDAFDEELFCDQIAFEFALEHFVNTFSYSDVHNAIRVFFMHMRVLEIFSSSFIESDQGAQAESAADTKEAPPDMSRNWSRALQSSLSLANDSEQALESLKRWSVIIALHHDRITNITLNTIKKRGARIWTANLQYDLKTRELSISKPS